MNGREERECARMGREERNGRKEEKGKFQLLENANEEKGRVTTEGIKEHRQLQIPFNVISAQQLQSFVDFRFHSTTSVRNIVRRLLLIPTTSSVHNNFNSSTKRTPARVARRYNIIVDQFTYSCRTTRNTQNYGANLHVRRVQ
uniref:Uncharacterized protein n=1 Tax=Globodera rostochiensis TaxID=31243 RepID=A0A914I0P1_GLORO